jgi:hypothetical protein
MTDNNTTTPPTDADQPDAQAGDPQPANADENRPPAGEASDADTAPDTDADDGKHQAFKYRRRLREAEAQRDALQAQLDALRDSVVQVGRARTSRRSRRSHT